MIIFLWIVIFQITVLILAYFRVRFILSTFVLAIYLSALTFYPFTDQQFNLTVFQSFLAFWIPFGIIALLFNIPILRRVLLMNPIRYFLKKSMPAISQTEKEALEAGTVWWDAELFSGKPDWNTLMAYPAPQLSAEEQAFMDGPVNEFCAMLSDWKINHEDYDLTPKAWQFLKDKGFFGMIIPKKYGGLEFSALGHSCVVMKIASRSTSGTVTVMVPNSLGPAELLLKYGTEEQKDHYLPRLAKGREIPCFALTGPEAGSDAGSMPDTGIICHSDFEGKKDVLGIRLNWDKRYITLGPVATVLGLAFKLYDPDHLLGDKEELGITLALIPTNTPGVSIGSRHVPLNQFFQVGPNWGKDVFIPMDWIIGGTDRVGQGWRMLMESLAAGRSISLPALSTGGGKMVCRATGAYSRIRKQFKIPIGRFEGIEEALARMAGNTYTMDAARSLTCVALDMGEKPSVISAIVKYNLTETLRQVMNDSMDVQGGSGICMGPGNLWASTYQGVPVSITVEGANILTRSLIIFGQGAIRCHPYALKEIQAIANPDSSVASKEFDATFFRHL
ncbi:MAG TPA: acyl-CoA dehydrogenase, partial [Spirochaetes bacterium]|nr:acyl-CoA dehydrogenase [Spirochaetota bacterium]